MFDVTIYTKQGRKMYDHVTQINSLTKDNIVLYFIKGFNDDLQKTLYVKDVEYITVRCMKND